MFNNLSSSGHGLFTRILLLFIVMSFVLWGIGDIFRYGFGDNSVASVGKHSISAQELGRAVAQRKADLRARLGKAYSPELLKKFGLERIALEGLINRALLEQEAASLGLVVGEKDVVDYIAHTPEFLDKNGQFSEEAYQAIIRANRMMEKDFIEMIKHDIANRLLRETVTGGMQPSEDMVRAMYRVQAEKRGVSLLLMPAGSVKAAPPSDKDVEAYYQEHSKQYGVPEYRRLSYIALKPEEVQAGIPVSEAELQKAYNERAEEFDQPERRVVDQLVFEKKEEADKAAAVLAAGKAIEEVAKASPVLNKDSLHLGEMTKSTLPTAADDVFALKEGGVSAPAQSAFGWHVMRVSRIIPPGRKPLAEVRDMLTRDIKANAAEDVMGKMASRLEDAMGGGATLEDAAKKEGLTLHAAEAVSQSGSNEHGASVALPYPNMLKVAFATAEKDHSRMVQADKGGYFMLRVDTVIPAHAKPLAEVKQEVLAALGKELEGKALQKTAEDIAAQLQAGKQANEVLAAKGIKAVFEPAGEWTANTQAVEQGALKGKSLPEGLVKEVFDQKKTPAITPAYALAEGGLAIARLERVIPAKDAYTLAADSAALKPVREELKASLDDEMMRSYLRYLRTKHPVTIKENLAGLLATGGAGAGDE